MEKEWLFDIWAPADSPWTLWAKGVVFAHWQAGMAMAPQAPALAPPGEVGEAPVEQLVRAMELPDTCAVVVDLPGEKGVRAGIELARHGWRPVPLYNAAPATWAAPAAAGTGEVVNVRKILLALAAKAPELERLRIPLDAPPAFLLDARRRGVPHVLDPGAFDNRSISFPTDFPSAAFLRMRGIHSAALVQDEELQPQADLAHTLLRWQEQGIEIFSQNLLRSGRPLRITVKRPAGFASVWHSLLSRLGLRRNSLGGHGGVSPMPDAAGG